MTIADFKVLDKLTQEGYLRRVVSLCGEMVLYNYSEKCTFSKHWNTHTINARGSVYELSTGNMVARAFPKFHNFEELPVSKSRNLFKKTEFEVFNKLDGSLGILFNRNGQWQVNTRGSFTSPQAIEATKMLSQYDMIGLCPEITYLVEIIYPENRVVLDYGDERKLVLLAAFVTKTGVEACWDFLYEAAIRSKMPLVERFEFKSIEDLIAKQATLPSSVEGFVVRFPNGERVKFKSKEYMKLSRILSNMTPLSFWEHMENGIVNQEVIEKFPEEFRAEVDEIRFTLESQYKKVKEEAIAEYDVMIAQAIGSDSPAKFIGLRLDTLKFSGGVFMYWAGKIDELDKFIIKQIKPVGNVFTKDVAC